MCAYRMLLVAMTAGQLVLACGQTFNKRFDPFHQGYEQVAFGIERNGENGFAVTGTGYFDDSVYLYTIPFLLRLDANGQVLSENKMIGGLSSIYGGGWSNSSQRTRDGGILIGGSTYNPGDIQNGAIIRFGPTGDSLWIKEYGDGVGEWIGRAAIQTKDQGYLLCGETASIGVVDGFLIKTDSLGNEQWRRTYGEPQWVDYITSVDTTADDGFFVGGNFRISQFNSELRVIRTDANGEPLWTKLWGGPYNEPVAQVFTKADGNALVSGTWGYAPDFAAARIYMAELNASDGSIVWQHEYGPSIDICTLYSGKEVRPGEGHIATGYAFEPNTNFFKGQLLRTADNGDSLWMRNYFYYDSLMTDGVGEFKDVIPTTDGGFIACGFTWGSYTGPTPPNYSQDAWVVKVDSLGCIVPGCNGPMGITSQITNMGYALNVYPNPVRDLLHVGIKLPIGFKTEGPLVLTIVTTDGKLVRQESLPTSAWDDMQIDVTGLLVGTYTIHLSDAHTWIAGKKFVVE
ncbi:MAG: T9SS type A sorting domain-containing protein [Flavobacteriales bacterium]|nr:T9SS type A sorting domain-containing protein [Flavobacteriales bacterium]